jgi:capsular exopolysaccharide synthesis family protein
LTDSTLVSPDEIAEAVRLEPYVKLIQRDLGVEPVRESRVTVKDTRLIEISFRHTDPELAAAVVNSIGETFVSANQEKRSGTNRKTSDFLQGRIADLQAQIRSDEVKLVEMQEQQSILKTGDTQTIAMDRLSALNKALLEAENRRKNAEAQYNSVKDDPEAMKALADQQTIQYTAERQNSILAFRNSVEKDINTLRANRQRMLVELKEKAPEIVEIDRQIQSLEDSVTKAVEKNNRELKDFRENTTDSILKNLRTKYLQAKSEEDKIRSAFDKQYAEAQGQNTGAVMLRLLEQNIETNKGFLENLQKQQSSNDVAAQGTDNNIRVQSFAIPPKTPVSPSRTMSVLGALFLSTLFGMGLALFLEYLDDTIRSTEEIENYLQLPALATIPAIDSTIRRKLLLVGSGGEESDPSATSELLISADTRSSLAEAYRQLRTSILLSTAGHPPTTLLITSSLPAEGNTTTATNTAISLAQTGAKVLIIDADMRRARLHSIFNLTNGEGLSTLLSSKLAEAEIAKAIKYDEGTKLHIMTSGPIPPNPAELIGSEQMAKLLKMLQTKFTHVVVDSPPIASFTDGVLIASMVDGVILVVHSGKSSRQIVRRARQFLVDVGAKIVGVVLNNVNLRAQDNYYYYQSYYHGDSYVTSQEEDEEE